MEAIHIENITKQYRDVTAVDGISLSIQEGELFTLLGVNGAGKTTLIRMLSCLTKPSSGDALLLGKSICRQPQEVKKIIAVSPQESAISPGLTVMENLDLMAGAYGLTSQERKQRANKMLETMGLEAIAGKRAGKLSGGWQRRLSIAMALISHPKILFLDEPTLGLDVLARSELWDLVSSLKGKITILLTTHYMEEAEALSDRIAILKEGGLLMVDSPQQILKKADANRLDEAFIRIMKGEIQ